MEWGRLRSPAMSVDALIRDMFDAVSRGDLDGLLALLNPDCELVSVMAPADGGAPYRGHEGIRQWWFNSRSTWDHYQLVPAQLLDLDPYVMGVLDLSAVGKTSGVPFERTMYACVEARDGKVSWVHADFDLPSALRVLAERVEPAV